MVKTRWWTALLVGLALTGVASAQDEDANDPFAEDDDPFADDSDPFAEYEELADPPANLTEDDDAGDAADDDAESERKKGSPGVGLVGLVAALGAAAMIVARKR